MRKQSGFKKRKTIWLIAIIASAVIYQVALPYLERQFHVDLPSLIDDNGATVGPPQRRGDESDREIPRAEDGEVSIGESSSPTAESSKQNEPDVASEGDGKPFLVATGSKNRLRSPAGLIYGESHGEHRVDHVMRHARDDPSRPTHSVFDGDRTTILKLIDEAYVLIRLKSNRVQKTSDERLDFRLKYTVDMQRKIGYLGGQQGRRQNFPPRSKLTLILDNDRFMVTAYPDR